MENLMNNNIDTVFSVDEKNTSIESALKEAIDFSIKNEKAVVLLYGDIYFFINKITNIGHCIERYKKVKNILDLQL